MNWVQRGFIRGFRTQVAVERAETLLGEAGHCPQAEIVRENPLLPQEATKTSRLRVSLLAFIDSADAIKHRGGAGPPACREGSAENKIGAVFTFIDLSVSDKTRLERENRQAIV